MATPITKRLRPRSDASSERQEKTGCSIKAKIQNKGESDDTIVHKTEEGPQGANRIKDMADQMSMQDLLVHMEELQKRTEDNMTKTINSAVDQSKKEINENTSTMINALTSSVDGMKIDLAKIQEKYDSKLEKLQTDFQGLKRKVEDSSGITARMDQQNKTENQRVLSRFKNIEEDIVGIKKSMTKELASMRSNMAREADQQRSMLDQQKQELQDWRNKMEHEMDLVKVKSLDNSTKVMQLTTSLDTVDAKVRAANITVTGLEENDPADTPIKSLLELIRKVLPDFQECKIKSAFRLGQPRKNKKRPRLLLVICDSHDTKELLLRRAGDIREKSTNKYLQLSRDQSDGARRRHALIKACYKNLVAAGHTCSMKGSLITYEKRQYGYDQLNLLPLAGRPEETRIRETADGMGLGYSSEHTYLSNFFPATIRFEDKLYTSVEHAFQHMKVKDAGYDELADEMMSLMDPYVIKSIGGGIEAKKSWIQQDEGVLEKLVRAKFEQNQELKFKLVESRYVTYYEMTKDKRWATGVKIPNDDHKLDPKNFNGKNKAGLLITRLRKEYRNELGLSNDQVATTTENECNEVNGQFTGEATM